MKEKEKPYLITKEELLMGRDKKYASSYTKEISDNLDKLLIPINELRYKYGKAMVVSSGWRPPAVNEATSNAAKKSNHLMGLAVDIRDVDGKLRDWCIENLEFIASLGLFLEDFRWTRGWVHFQCVPPGSGKRVFIPSTKPAPYPEAWSGKYDKALDS